MSFFPPSSAIIEHTNRVIFLEDDDIAAVADGKLSIHRIKRSASDDPSRAIQTLQMELQQIMKGRYLPRVPVHLPQKAGTQWSEDGGDPKSSKLQGLMCELDGHCV